MKKIVKGTKEKSATHSSQCVSTRNLRASSGLPKEFKIKLANRTLAPQIKSSGEPVFWNICSKPFKAQHWPCTCADLARLPQSLLWRRNKGE